MDILDEDSWILKRDSFETEAQRSLAISTVSEGELRLIGRLVDSIAYICSTALETFGPDEKDSLASFPIAKMFNELRMYDSMRYDNTYVERLLIILYAGSQ